MWEDDDYNAFLKAGVRGVVSDFGPRSTIGARVIANRGLDGYDLSWDGIEFRFPLPGRHNLLDAVGAAAVASRAGASAFEVARALRGEAAIRPLGDLEGRVYDRARLL